MAILIIADDLTGAADCAAPFRQAGLSAVALINAAACHAAATGFQVVSLSLHTRDAPASGVRRAWGRHASAISQLAQSALVYQKIDSTLRGHPALEVRLLLDLLGAPAAVIAPAFPKQGRQTIDGVHRVQGVPLTETEYARKRPRRQASSRLPEIFTQAREPWPAHLPWLVIARGAEMVATWLRARLAEGCRLITADAAAESHLDTLTQAVLSLKRRLLLVGSAGWAERLAVAVPSFPSPLMGRSARIGPPLPPGEGRGEGSALTLALCQGERGRRPRRDHPGRLTWRLYPSPFPERQGENRPGALGVVGSLSAMATRQVQSALEAGVTVVQFDTTMHKPLQHAAGAEWQLLAKTVAAGRHAIIWTTPGNGMPMPRQEGPRVLRALGSRVRGILSITAVSGLMIIGGDTAEAVLRALHTSGLTLAGQVAAGIPYGRLLDGLYAGLPVVTKAGGFGEDTTLLDGMNFLQHWTPQ